jgi:hypothetical protein
MSGLLIFAWATAYWTLVRNSYGHGLPLDAEDFAFYVA